MDMRLIKIESSTFSGSFFFFFNVAFTSVFFLLPSPSSPLLFTFAASETCFSCEKSKTIF